ncbi:MAG: ABC transporter ATP-binding protein [Terriglobales bacterium]|jgi:lipopolysaccharide transport system ATP-binding protein
MTDVAIRCEGLAKQYRIGERESYKALRDVITDAFASPFRSLRSGLRHSSNGSASAEKPNIWALNDVSFEIKRGEVVGIIGRNGAGKSTLLKILSRITDPTHGHADIWGRVGSLLEVGTGFHPELTGRDNIFLNGAILGMNRAEIARKFDEIVAFAELEKFIDTPVKRYSSGMYMRLAFAVAAHLELEILLVDEVLAVGDASFQKKCLGKMGQVSREGRTILFVSHNMAAVKALCRKAILMRDGAVAASGMVADVADDYLLDTASGASAREWRDPATAPGNESVRISYIRISPPKGSAEITIDTGVQIEIGFENLLENINLGCTVYLTNREGVLIFESGHRISSDRDSRCGFYQVTGRIPGHLLNAGRYSLDVVFGKDQRYVLLRIDGVVSFEVENTATGRGSNMSVAPGVIRPLLSWCHSFKEESSLVK